uniref:Uncharacterized protein n=1 Tax=Corvus moneduloides TaxID=1196302 RepID=A0A8U7NAZ6_CORMO
MSPKEATEGLRGLEPRCSGARLGELGVLTWRGEGSRQSSEPLAGVTKASSLSSFLYPSSDTAATTAGKKPVTPGPPLRKWEISKDEPYL